MRPSATSASLPQSDPRRVVLLPWIKQEDDHGKVMSLPAVVALVVRSESKPMTEDERRQKRREAGLKGAQTKGKERLREIALKRAQTMGKERLRQAVLKGHAKRSSGGAERDCPEGCDDPRAEPCGQEKRGLRAALPAGRFYPRPARSGYRFVYRSLN
jgi:hypothetical protein